MKTTEPINKSLIFIQLRKLIAFYILAKFTQTNNELAISKFSSLVPVTDRCIVIKILQELTQDTKYTDHNGYHIQNVS
jgi:hypothetical protein